MLLRIRQFTTMGTGTTTDEVGGIMSFCDVPRHGLLARRNE